MPRFTKTTALGVKYKNGRWRPKTSKENSRDQARRGRAFAAQAGNRERRNANARALRRTRALRGDSGLLDPLIDRVIIPLFMWAVKLLVKLLLLPFKVVVYVVLLPFKKA